MDQPHHSEIIDFLGGTAAVAKICNIAAPSVTEWRQKGIPEGRLLVLAPVLEFRPGTKWTRKTLFPDTWATVWPELAVVEA